MAASGRAHANVTNINLASSTGKKVQSTDEILKQIESTLPDVSQQNLARGGLSARLQGRINEHELTYGDKSLPRQRLPKVDNVLLDRYQAARHNVLVLGAIKQAEKSKPNTHRSNKAASHTPRAGSSHHSHTPSVAASTSVAGGPLGLSDSHDDMWPDAASSGAILPGPSDLDSNFNSFKSRVSSKALGSIPEDALSAQPSASNLNPEASHISSRAGRRYARQGSNSSVASRVSAASFASGLTGASYPASSSGQAHHLRQQHSYLSSGGSSGHTMRSHRAGSVAGSSWGGNHKKGAKKKPPKPEPGRVTRAFTEFGSRDDWVSQTVLKHTLAAIIQARWRGYHVRQRWKVNREQLVLEEKARLEADSLHQARLQDLQHKLYLYQQKKLAQAAAEAAAAAATGDATAGVETAAAVPVAAGVSTGISRAVSGVWQRGEGGLGPVASRQSVYSAGELCHAGDAHTACCSDSDSGWSDVELDDVAAIKFRAVTPPWQLGAERQQLSLQLQQRIAVSAAAAMGEPLQPGLADWSQGLGGFGCAWDSIGNDNTAKLKELKHRRICRKPDPVVLSAPAVAAAATAGLLADPLGAADAEGGTSGPNQGTTGAADADGDDEGQGTAAAALPQQVVEALLLERYSSKFTRLGLPHKMPGRERWLRMQMAAAAAAADGRFEEEAQEEEGGAGQGGGADVGSNAAAGQPAGADLTSTAPAASACITCPVCSHARRSRCWSHLVQGLDAML